MEDFNHYRPSRRDLNFRDLHQEQSDEFYETHFGKLVVEVYAAAERTFFPIGKHKAPKKSPWLREYCDSFYKYAQALANPDSHTGHWDRLLRDSEERTFLLSAIIMKILDTHVLSSLLFGADHGQMKILQSLDTSFVNAEGFTRSKVRAEVNSLYLKTMDDDVPPLFWQEVDEITTRLVSLLLPVYAYTFESYNWEPPAVQSLYQSLHGVVAYAGWINASIRLSPGVIATEWTLPGAQIQMKEEHLSQEIFNHSKAMVRKAQNRLGEQSILGLSRRRVARVKISVTPKIIRHAPRLTDYDGEKDVPGTSSYTVLKSHVVYYQGRQKDSEERALYISLPDYIQQLRNRKKAPYIPALIIMLLGILIVCALHVDLGRQASTVWTWIQQVIPVPDYGATRTVRRSGSGVRS